MLQSRNWTRKMMRLKCHTQGTRFTIYLHELLMRNKKATTKGWLLAPALLLLVASGDNALPRSYGVAIAVKCVARENGLTRKFILLAFYRSGFFFFRSTGSSTLLIHRGYFLRSGYIAGLILWQRFHGYITSSQSQGHQSSGKE